MRFRPQTVRIMCCRARVQAASLVLREEYIAVPLMPPRQLSPGTGCQNTSTWDDIASMQQATANPHRLLGGEIRDVARRQGDASHHTARIFQHEGREVYELQASKNARNAEIERSTFGFRDLLQLRLHNDQFPNGWEYVLGAFTCSRRTTLSSRCPINRSIACSPSEIKFRIAIALTWIITVVAMSVWFRR